MNNVNLNHTYGQKEAERHKTLATERIYGSSIHASIKTFHEKIQYGCIFVCSVCHQTNFEEHVIPVKRLCSSTHQVLLHDCLTDSAEYICLTCKKSIYRGQVPKLSIKNKCGFPIQPPELILFPLEERLISPIIPFMNVRECPVGGQKAIHGSICHVPVDVAPTVNSLPHALEENDTISVKIKHKRSYKHHVLPENIRPNKVLKGLHYVLEHKEMFLKENIQINAVMLTADSTSVLSVETVFPSTDDIEEEEEDPCNAPSTNTMLDENHTDPSNKTLLFAPGEGKRPVFHEPLAEYLCFPTIFCGQECPRNAERICPLYQ